MAKQDRGKRRHRGTGFPRLSLQGAVKVVEEAYRSGTEFTKEAFASYGTKRGKGAVASGAYFNRLAALTDFGLIVQRGDTVELTELAKRIVAPGPEDDRTLAIQEAFMACDIFRNIHTRMTKDGPVAGEQVANLASRQFGVASGNRDAFLRSFALSGDYAALLEVGEGGVLRFVEAKEGALPEPGAEGEEPPPGEAKRPRPSGQPVIDEVWGDEATGLRLLVYSTRPLMATDYKSLGEIAEKVQQLFDALGSQQGS